MVKNIIGFLSLVVLLTACSNEVFIDNPSKKDVKVIVKGKEILVKANSFERLKISEGVNSILAISTNGDTLLNQNVDIFDSGILNITNSKYAIWKDVFCEEADYKELKSKLNIKDTVVIDGLGFIDLDLELVDEVFISQKWDLGLDNIMPESIEIGDEEEFKIIAKIYRTKELKKIFNYYGDYDFKGLTEEEINKVLKNTKNN